MTEIVLEHASTVSLTWRNRLNVSSLLRNFGILLSSCLNLLLICVCKACQLA